MDIANNIIPELRSMVSAARRELDNTISYHEAWKPTAYDPDVHRRMDHSFAGHTFKTIRAALRSQMLLSLASLWDSNKHGIKLQSIPDIISNDKVIEAFAWERVVMINLQGSLDQMKEDMNKQRNDVLLLIRKYMAGGSDSLVLEELKTIRHERLAHRQIQRVETKVFSTKDTDIENFYLDNCKIVSKLENLVNAGYIDPKDIAGTYEYYSRKFWAGVRSEKIEGHPEYRQIPTNLLPTHQAYSVESAQDHHDTPDPLIKQTREAEAPGAEADRPEDDHAQD